MIWKPIPNFEEIYEISEFGNVRNIKTGRAMSSFNNGRGYLILSLSRKGQYHKSIHRLVASAFIKNSNMTVNHKDGNKLNNHYSNLEYLTLKDNINHALKIGKGNRKLSNKDVLDVREEYSKGIDFTTLKKKYNVSKQSIYCIVKKKTYIFI